jgi:S1-C subfamily serine protease
MGTLLAVFLALGLVSPARAASGFLVLPDFPVPNGHFYSQASGQGSDFGFAMTDEGGIAFYAEFTRLGSVDALGYPSSNRFALGGFVTQATQKALLQWRPDSQRVEFVNVFDLFTQRGLDPTLAHDRLIPPTEDNAPDSQLSWSRVVARHLALLDQDPAIRARYLADPQAIRDYGLPQGAEDFGGVFVLRSQRAAFQHWRIATSFAQPGDVTQVNAGDLAKEFGLVPASAGVPVAAASQLVAPPGARITADPAVEAAARHAVETALPGLVRIDVMFADGFGIASGIVLDANGNVLTNQHVVDQAEAIRVTLANGVSTTARLVGADVDDDLAVVRVAPDALRPPVAPATFVAASTLSPGQFVVALGFTPYFASPPATRLGIFQRLSTSGITIVRTDAYILPGDSGGMLLDLKGNVVAINDEIRFTRDDQQPLIGFSIDGADALRIGRRLSLGS